MAALTYYLTSQCGHSRQFCKDCTNSFTESTCDSLCTDGPSVICLEPKVPSDYGSCCCDPPEQYTKKYIAVLYGIPSITSAAKTYPASTGPNTVIYSDISPGTCGMGFSTTDLQLLPIQAAGFESWIYTGSNCSELFRRSQADTATNGFISQFNRSTDITTGLKCNQPLRFEHVSTAVHLSSSGADGSYIILYPIPES